MTEQGIRNTLERMLVDEGFARSFFANRTTTLERSGYDLSPLEIRAFSRIGPREISAMRMDSRLVGELSNLIACDGASK